ncbi:MAG: hypothetical protein AB1427_02205 [Thermodesulfobacteriota bacterium]
MKKNHSPRQIIIKDNSIVICLSLTVLLITAGLVLAKAPVLGEAGVLYADSIQPRVFRFKIDTKPVQQSKSVPAADVDKPEVKKPAALSGPISPAPKADKTPRTKPAASTEKTETKALPKAGDPPKTESQTPPKTAERTAASENILKTLRGGRHPQYASIVFECAGPIVYDKPQVQGDVIRFTLKKMETRLRPYRKYKTFDSWVRLDKADGGLDVSIGVLPGFKKFSDFLMEDPPRMVINMYDKGN